MLDGKTLVSSDFVESSTMTVDAENNPFANTLGLSSWNNWIAIYLTLKRVPNESIWAFLNQPILVELYNRLNIQGFVNKNYVIAELIAEYFPEFVPVEHRSALTKKKARKLIAYLQSIVLSDKFRQKTLMDALSPNAYSGTKNKNLKTLQFHVLTYFVQADQEAKLLQKLRKNTNFPSRKITSILEVNSIHETNRFLLRSPFLASTKNYFNRALSMSYDSLDIFKAVYSAMFPISSYSEIARLFIKNENKYVDEEESNPFAPQKNVWTDVQKSKAEKILTNDVMFGILQNFGFPFGNIAKNVRLGEIALGPSDTILITGKKGAYIIQERTEDGYKLVSLDGVATTAKFNEVTPIETFKLADDVKHRVWNGKGGRPIIDDIFKLKDKYPELEELFPILKRFNANIDSKDKRYVNVELFRQNANEKPDKDSYITQLKALANHNNFEISGVFSELMLVAFYQSGYNMSPLYFTDLLDTNNSLSRMIHSANSTFLRLKEDAPELADLFLKELAKKIRLNNPNFYYYKTDKDTGQFLEKVNFKYHRGKDYSINMNDLALQLLENKLIAKIEGVDTQSDPVIKFGETAVQDFISGKKKSIISKTVYKDGVYSLNGSKEKIKVFLLGEANYQLSEGKDVIIVSGKINSPNIKTAVYDEDLDLSIIDLESFAKVNGYNSFKEMKDTSIVLKTSLEEGSSFNVYDAIYVKLNEQSASFPGLKIVRNALTREEQLELFDYLKPIIEKSAAVTNKAADANIMLGLGLRWDYKSNNPKLTPVPVGKTIRGRNAAYAYYNQDINGKPLEPISDRLKELVNKATGIDVSAYDGAIINIYTPNTHIGNHADEDESDTAIKYPVVAVNIGGNGNFNIGDDKTKKTFYDLPDGTGYAFGINGVNRRAPHFTQASPIEGFLPALHINHEKADIKLEKGSYRMTITLRRVMSIQKSSPVVQTSTKVVTQAPKEGTLEQVIDSLSKSKSTKIGNSMIYTSNGKIFVSFKKEANLKVNLEFSTAEKAYQFASNVDSYKSYAAKRDFAKKVENGDVKPSSVVAVENPTSEPTPEEKIVRTLSTRENPINIYSDGSDIKGTGKLGFGAVYVYNGTEYYLTGTEEGQDVKDLMDKFPDMKFSNPTMEMLALARSLESFSETGEHIVINQDYKGAVNYDGLWQHAEESAQRDAKPWKAKEKYISYLVDRSVAAIKRIEDNGGSVKINWVKGHAGDKMNDLADKYAKDRRNESTFTTPLVPVEIENNFVSSNPDDIDTGEIDPDDFSDVSVTEEYIGEDAPYDPTQDPYFGYSAESETNFQNPDNELEGNTDAKDFEC
jgi:ribonuclease HI/alkylated DNA repair dioxygenase AlkB